jgi:hypothetical protein
VPLSLADEKRGTVLFGLSIPLMSAVPSTNCIALFIALFHEIWPFVLKLSTSIGFKAGQA